MGKIFASFLFTLFLTFPGLFPVLPVSAQEIPVVIKAINKQNQPVPDASITTIDRMDTLQKISQVADSEGQRVNQDRFPQVWHQSALQFWYPEERRKAGHV